MNPLSRDGAIHFCGGFSPASPSLDIRDLYDSTLRKLPPAEHGEPPFFREGTPTYSIYRDSVLRESDRSFFLAISCFRRALSLFTPSSVFWAHVSLYYSMWFAAHSIAGMFGCWVGGSRPRQKEKIVIDVRTQTPGAQEFQVRKDYPSTQSSPHRFFWEAYYVAMRSVILWTDPTLTLAVSPVGNDPTWAIEHRNRINYRTTSAFDVMSDYLARFDPAQFPASLHSEVGTQFNLARIFLVFCAQKATEFGLTTDVHMPFPTRADAIRDLIYQPVPADLSAHIERATLCI